MTGVNARDAIAFKKELMRQKSTVNYRLEEKKLLCEQNPRTNIASYQFSGNWYFT